MSYCLVCGYANVVGTLFCEECGYDLTSGGQGHPQTGNGVAATPATAGATDAGLHHGGVPAEDTAAASRLAPAVPGATATEAMPARPQSAAPREGVAGPAAPASAAPGSIQPVAPPQESVAAPTPGSVGATVAAPAVYLTSDSGRRVDVPRQDVVIVGREDIRSGIRPDVDLTLDGAGAAGISRRHCRLLRQPDGWYVEDLMSTNYTVLNGKPLRAHVPMRLTHGDELRLGKLRLRFHET